ncbi:hypothetical protein LXL04_006402 [Taraxacum kok-saghyz]
MVLSGRPVPFSAANECKLMSPRPPRTAPELDPLNLGRFFGYGTAFVATLLLVVGWFVRVWQQAGCLQCSLHMSDGLVSGFHLSRQILDDRTTRGTPVAPEASITSVRRRGGGDGVAYTNQSSSCGSPRVAVRVRSLSFRGLPFPDATGKVGYNLTS